jgi:hypothetical protein
VLTDDEADTIRRRLTERWRGPVLLTWLEQLLQDRDERGKRERLAREAVEAPLLGAALALHAS